MSMMPSRIVLKILRRAPFVDQAQQVGLETEGPGGHALHVAVVEIFAFVVHAKAVAVALGAERRRCCAVAAVVAAVGELFLRGDT
jgi:hypothetical protein